MCGIVGCVGSDDALQIMLDGLRKLEYRGYDSAGVAVVSDGELAVERRAGRLGVLEGQLNRSWLEGSMGIGHTRWATHGAPTDANAHPHRDCTGRIAIVHNGIIENHDVLRDRLQEEGHRFRSQTDTEVVAHLLESLRASGVATLREAVLEAVKVLEGAFALVCISLDEPDKIIVARQEPPLIVGATDT
ncbi:MAG TPA: class II glutamine amidotransferase, partial [Actinomycetota bacterium]|nr:class II glutamine amidotransferase [Actinomycetota bacterium]